MTRLPSLSPSPSPTPTPAAPAPSPAPSLSLARSLKLLRYALEAFFAYLLYGFFRLLPLRLAADCGGAVLRWIGPKLAVSRRARRRIEQCLPKQDANKILAGMWENLGRNLAELPHLNAIAARVQIEGLEHIEAARARGPVVFATGHFANWEVIALAGVTLGLDLAVIFREPNNPFVRKLLAYARRSWRQRAKAFAKSRAGGLALFQHVRAGGSAALLMDQRLNDGVAIDFFAKPAMTTPAVAELALRCGGVIVPAYCVRQAHGDYVVRAEAPLAMPDATLPRAVQVQQILLNLHARFETWITARPQEWLWLHDRWEGRL